MSEAAQPSFATPRAAAAATPLTMAELAGKTDQVETLKLQGAKLDEQIASLTDENEEKRSNLRSTFIEKHAKRFGDFDPKIALRGGRCEHAITVEGVVTYFVSVPSSAK